MAQQELTNVVLQYLQTSGEPLEKWEGLCGELMNKCFLEGDDVLYVAGPAVLDSQWGWIYHMVLLRTDMVHDAWCPVQWPLSIKDWLFKMFNENSRIVIAINGDDIYEGLCKDFSA